MSTVSTVERNRNVFVACSQAATKHSAFMSLPTSKESLQGKFARKICKESF
jgi:hypothetical protein